jgi:hypothetical protein
MVRGGSIAAILARRARQLQQPGCSAEQPLLGTSRRGVSRGAQALHVAGAYSRGGNDEEKTAAVQRARQREGQLANSLSRAELPPLAQQQQQQGGLSGARARKGRGWGRGAPAPPRRSA